MGYKITDGINIGLIIKLSSGKTCWFFESELVAQSSDISINYSKNTNYKNSHIQISYSKDITEVLNPFNFIKWIRASLRDIV